MTVVLNKGSAIGTAGWSQMPGWGIVADLTPPELRARRALAVIRRWIAAALALVVLLCIVGFVGAQHSQSSAQSGLDAAQSRTASLQASVAAHSRVTQVQAATASIDAQLAQVFTGDVDVPALVRDLADALPTGMAVTSVDVSLDATSGTDVDTIGTVTLAGTSRTLAELTRYVLALQTVSGVTGVIPSTNAVSGGGTSWTLVLQLTPDRYAHRFASAASTAPATSTSGTAATPGTTPTTTPTTTTGGN